VSGGNDSFCPGEVVACYNLRYRHEHCMLYSNIPCFLASELSVFSIKEPHAHLRNSWMLLKMKFKVLSLFTSTLHIIAGVGCSKLVTNDSCLVFAYIIRPHHSRSAAAYNRQTFL